jgi:hypothetical protein
VVARGRSGVPWAAVNLLESRTGRSMLVPSPTRLAIGS